jgi:hypothetical protein
MSILCVAGDKVSDPSATERHSMSQRCSLRLLERRVDERLLAAGEGKMTKSTALVKSKR